MKKIYMQFNAYGDYSIPKMPGFLYSRYHELYTLCMALDKVDLPCIEVEEIEIDNVVAIWSRDDIKSEYDYEDLSLEEFSRLTNRHTDYFNKRWEEIPRVELTIQAWNDLQEQWSQIKKDKPKYIMIELDESGRNDPAVRDKLTITPKDELSQEDLDYIKQEHEKYLKYQAAKQKYIENHPDYSEVWRGPQDDEYEADIMKYYEE